MVTRGLAGGFDLGGKQKAQRRQGTRQPKTGDIAIVMQHPVADHRANGHPDRIGETHGPNDFASVLCWGNVGNQRTVGGGKSGQTNAMKNPNADQQEFLMDKAVENRGDRGDEQSDEHDEFSTFCIGEGSHLGPKNQETHGKRSHDDAEFLGAGVEIFDVERKNG